MISSTFFPLTTGISLSGRIAEITPLPPSFKSRFHSNLERLYHPLKGYTYSR